VDSLALAPLAIKMHAIPTINETIAAGIVLSPKILPSTIKKAATKHNEIPNTNETYSQRIIIPSFQAKSKPVKI
jgi:hypothetical protein